VEGEREERQRKTRGKKDRKSDQWRKNVDSVSGLLHTRLGETKGERMRQDEAKFSKMKSTTGKKQNAERIAAK
jgi:hypothetical protein